MLSIIISERGNAAKYLHMWLANVVSGQTIHLLQAEHIGAYQTFVWNDRFSLIGGDALKIRATASANIDVGFSSIEQSWVYREKLNEWTSRTNWGKKWNYWSGSSW